MDGELEHIQKRLAEEGEKAIVFFLALSDPDWEQLVYLTGSQWKVHQILAHFISAERAYQRYIQDVMQGGPGVPKELDIDAFNESEIPPLSLSPISELIEAFRQARTESLDLVRTLTESDLARAGYHPWFQEKELGWFLKLLYRHNMIHLRDVQESLAKGQPVPPRN